MLPEAAFSDQGQSEAPIEFRKTEIYREIEKTMTPGKWMRTLREVHGLSQSEFGAKVGAGKPIRASRISDWENDFRAISKPVAKRLAAFFGVSADRFI